MGWGKHIEGGDNITGVTRGVEGEPVSDLAVRLQALAAIDPHFHDPMMGNGAPLSGGKGSSRGK